MRQSAISVKHVTKIFGEDTVLKDINQDFESGMVHGIVGFNGSGKTVLFKCICGFMRPTEGSILVNNKRIGKDIDFPESLGMIIESPGFLGNYSGMKNLFMLASLKKRIGEKEIRQAMEVVGLDPDSKKHVSKYSLGMRQRLGIAQAIMEDPELLILDEPFNGLDKKMAEKIRGLILYLKNEGKTILLASHNAVDIDTLCDTVFEMDAGVIKRVK